MGAVDFARTALVTGVAMWASVELVFTARGFFCALALGAFANFSRLAANLLLSPGRLSRGFRAWVAAGLACSHARFSSSLSAGGISDLVGANARNSGQRCSASRAEAFCFASKKDSSAPSERSNDDGDVGLGDILELGCYLAFSAEI